MKRSFKLMGTGAGPGTPSFFCECAGCLEARQYPKYSRTRSGAVVKTEIGNILVDAPPDLRVQLLREQIKDIDNIFMTHWHYDHFGGLGELEYYGKLARKQKVPLYLPPSAQPEFAAAFPNLFEVFEVKSWSFGEQYWFGGLSITPLAACHGIETAGFLVETVNKRLAYFPDTSGMPATTAHKVKGVDWLICDATFCGDNWFPQVHMSAEQAIELGKALSVGQTVLTHMSIHYSRPVVNSELAALAAKQAGVKVGYDGMVFEL
ncbi:MAG: phnP [Firmicutes bacterium]|nr:phnP [Bacillota bacterium]